MVRVHEMPLSSGEGQEEGILLLVLKRHFVFRSREKNVKHLELRALSAQSFKHNFHRLHRTCCPLVALSRGHLRAQAMGTLISAQSCCWECTPCLPLFWGSPAWCLWNINFTGWVSGTRLTPLHLQASYWGVKEQKPRLGLSPNWSLALPKPWVGPCRSLASCPVGAVGIFGATGLLACGWPEGRGFWRTHVLMNAVKLFLQEVSLLSRFGNWKA